MGKGIKSALDKSTWTKIEDTPAGANIEQNWQALFSATVLFQKLATEVADILGFEHLHTLDRQVTAYLEIIREHPRS